SEISAQLKQQGSKMGIPLNLQEKGKEGRTLGRAILPGKSEIHIFFLIPVKNPSDAKFTDKLLFDTNNSYRPIFFQPKDLSLNFGKAKAEKLEKDIPGDMGAYKLNYSGKETVEITISGDAVLKPRESHGKETRRKLVNGNIFTSSTKSLLGVFAVFGLLLSLSFIFVYRQSRV
ncbi:MAG: hypothetical protein KDK45_20445, partial [Leptospiraceae bacterium]|nr:hypothetical protein [Leptospiraceae bacterium]